EGSWHYAIAQATVNAVRMFVGFVGAELQLALGGVSVIDDPDPVVLVSVTAGLAGQELSLMGSAMVGGDPQRAVAKAVLQALNRPTFSSVNPATIPLNLVSKKIDAKGLMARLPSGEAT